MQELLHELCQPGRLVVRAGAPGLEDALIEVALRPCVRPPHVPEMLDVDSLTYFAKMEG